MGGNQPEFRGYRLAAITHAHQFPCLDPDRFHALKETTIGIQLLTAFMTRQPEISGAGNDHRHGHIHAGDLNPVNNVDDPARWQERPGGRPRHIHEIQLNRGRAPGNTINGGAALIMGHAPRGFDTRQNPCTGVDGPDADIGDAFPWLNQPHFHRGRANPGQDIAAGRLEIHQPVLNADLGEEIIDISPVIIGSRQHGNLGGDSVAAADTINVERMAGANRADQHPGQQITIPGQVTAPEIGTTR